MEKKKMKAMLILGGVALFMVIANVLTIYSWFEDDTPVPGLPEISMENFVIPDDIKIEDFVVGEVGEIIEEDIVSVGMLYDLGEYFEDYLLIIKDETLSKMKRRKVVKTLQTTWYGRRVQADVVFKDTYNSGSAMFLWGEIQWDMRCDIEDNDPIIDLAPGTLIKLYGTVATDFIGLKLLNCQIETI